MLSKLINGLGSYDARSRDVVSTQEMTSHIVAAIT